MQGGFFIPGEGEARPPRPSRVRAEGEAVDAVPGRPRSALPGRRYGGGLVKVHLSNTVWIETGGQRYIIVLK